MSTILVAGATGNLGHRIVQALLQRGASVRVLQRPDTQAQKLEALTQAGAQVVQADYDDPASLEQACQGVDCVVSALQGLEDVIVDAQDALLQAAVRAGVPRFIPSDYSTDFTQVPEGQNRNFDLRRRFRQRLDAAAIQATSIFNGAFAEVIGYNPRLLNRAQHQIGYYGYTAFSMDFTTMDDTAAFTAGAALDPQAPRDLYIASFQANAEDFARAATAVFGEPFTTVLLGAPGELEAQARQIRGSSPTSEQELFPVWQQMQYVVGMSTVHHPRLDNDRYPGLTWTSLEQQLGAIKQVGGSRPA